MIFYSTIVELLFFMGFIMATDKKAPSDFVEVFKDAVDQLGADARAAGTNLTAVCREMKISRATPDRWKREVPMTVNLLAQMQNIIREKAKSNSTTR